MPQIQVSTKEELNKAVYELAKLIQIMAKDEQSSDPFKPKRSVNLAALVQSTANLIDQARPYLD